MQEVNAAVTRVNNGFSTRSSETMEMAGGDFYSNCDQLKQEEEALREVKEIASSTKQQTAESKPGNK